MQEIKLKIKEIKEIIKIVKKEKLENFNSSNTKIQIRKNNKTIYTYKEYEPWLNFEKELRIENKDRSIIEKHYTQILVGLKKLGNCELNLDLMNGLTENIDETLEPNFKSDPNPQQQTKNQISLIYQKEANINTIIISQKYYDTKHYPIDYRIMTKIHIAICILLDLALITPKIIINRMRHDYNRPRNPLYIKIIYNADINLRMQIKYIIDNIQ